MKTKLPEKQTQKKFAFISYLFYENKIYFLIALIFLLFLRQN